MVGTLRTRRPSALAGGETRPRSDVWARGASSTRCSGQPAVTATDPVGALARRGAPDTRRRAAVPGLGSPRRWRRPADRYRGRESLRDALAARASRSIRTPSAVQCPVVEPMPTASTRASPGQATRRAAVRRRGRAAAVGPPPPRSTAGDPWTARPASAGGRGARCSRLFASPARVCCWERDGNGPGAGAVPLATASEPAPSAVHASSRRRRPAPAGARAAAKKAAQQAASGSTPLSTVPALSGTVAPTRRTDAVSNVHEPSPAAREPSRMTSAPRRKRPVAASSSHGARARSRSPSSASARSTTDTLGAGNLFDRAVARVDRFLAGPVPDRRGAGTVLVTEPEEDAEELDPDEVPIADAGRRSRRARRSRRSPRRPPARRRRRRSRASRSKSTSSPIHEAVFAHELKDTWCAPAGVQMVLAILGHGDTSRRVPARDPGPRPRVGELRGQPQRRLGPVGDGPRARGVRGAGLRGPRLQDARRAPCAMPPRRSRRPTRRPSCWPGAARTPGS